MSKKEKDIFEYNRLLKPICKLFTNHTKKRKLISWDASFNKDSGYKYANRHDFYYKCKYCGWVYFNNKPTEEDIEYIKKYDEEHEE